jgi:hypothetical protein
VQVRVPSDIIHLFFHCNSVYWNRGLFSLMCNCGGVIMQLPTGTSFYGTGEVGGGLERTGKRVCNLTVFY